LLQSIKKKELKCRKSICLVEQGDLEVEDSTPPARICSSSANSLTADT
jgi:hypothetical protein